MSLINTENKGRHSKLLESLNATAKDPKTSKIDWSDDAITESYVKYYTSAFDDAYIKDEISMLQNLDKEINRIKLKDPDGFYKSERYMELGKALEELKICGATEIGKLAWKYGLI